MRILPLLSLAAALTVASAPAFAQAVEELVITGHSRGERPTSASQTVSYADLNLTQAADRDTLKHRIVAAAKDVCRQIGEEAPLRGNLGKSCQDNAIRDAMVDVRTAFADAATYQAFAAPEPVTYDAGALGANVSATVAAGPTTNGPIPDTAANRAR
ncbi:MAG TPA: UrcA family protein, partial [Phenylobacterium sp.]|nr:UrcA family protein [Phenylobacterium sp.]